MIDEFNAGQPRSQNVQNTHRRATNHVKSTKIGRPFRDALFMGEEKPDEELMGKRKSSPRLSTTSCDADNYSFSVSGKFIHPVFEKKLM